MQNSFTGGEALTKKLQDMMEKLGITSVVKVGLLEGSTCGRDNDQSAPQIAFIHEFGAPEANIPPRPFRRITIDTNSPTWGRLLKAAIKLARYDSEMAMGIVGQAVGEQMQQTIQSDVDPPNAPATAARKKFSGGEAMTLRDSKNLLRAISFEVNNTGGKKVNEAAS